MIKIKQKRAMSIPINIIFAIFIVMFVFFIMFQVSTSRAKNEIQKENFEYYDYIYNYMLSMLSNKYCYTFAGEDNKNTPKQGLLYIDKIVNESDLNRDLVCVDNTKFLPSILIVDKHTGKRWELGITRKEKFEWVDREITTSLPIAIYYDSYTVNGGDFILTAMIGKIPSFYGKIKSACIKGQSMTVNLKTNYNIRYNTSLNLFEIADDFFYPYFNCKVSTFHIKPGNHIIYLKYDDKSNELKVVV